MPTHPMTGFDSISKFNRHISHLSAIDAKNDRYLTNLKEQARDNFTSLNRRLGKKATHNITSIDKTHFSYGAFRKKINGEDFGVSKVVSYKLKDRFPEVVEGYFNEIGEGIRVKKFYEDIRNMVEGFNKPLQAVSKISTH